MCFIFPLLSIHPSPLQEEKIPERRRGFRRGSRGSYILD